MREQDSSPISGSGPAADLDLEAIEARAAAALDLERTTCTDVPALVAEVRRLREELVNEEHEYDKLDTRAAEHARAETTLRRKYGEALVHIEALCVAGKHVVDSEGGSEDEHQAFGELRAAMKAAGR